MSHRFSLSKVSAIILLASQAFYVAPALAAGFQINEMSPSLQGDAMAGAAAASNDVSAMFINPATLTTLLQNQFYLGASEIMPSIGMKDASATHTVNVPGSPDSSVSVPVRGLSEQNSISKPAFVPDAYIGYRFNDKLVGGLAVTAPYGLTTKYKEDSVVRYAAVYSSVETIDINPALAYAITDSWSVGAGFQWQYVKAAFSNFNGPYYETDHEQERYGATSPTYLKGDSWGYGYTLGILYKPTVCSRIGLGYRSQVAQSLQGEGQQYTEFGSTVPAPSGDFLYNADTSVSAGLKVPAALTLGAVQDFQTWSLKGTVQLNFWDSFDKLNINMPEAFATNANIPTKYSNAWFASIGADYRWSDAFTLRGGVAYDQTPTSDTYRDPRIPDVDRYWLNVGASYAMDKHFSFDAAYSHLFMPDQTVNVTQSAGSSATSTLPLEVNQVSAKYSGAVDIVALAVRYSF